MPLPFLSAACNLTESQCCAIDLAQYRTFFWSSYNSYASVDAERRENIHVRVGIDEASFVRMRIARDAKLAMPALILPSAQSICAPDACRPRKTTIALPTRA